MFRLEKETINNKYFRRVVQTTDNLQLVLMSIKTNIPLEIHKKTDQFFRVEKGNMVVKYSKHKNGPFNTVLVSAGSSFIIPKGTFHEIINIGPGSLKLYTIYSPPKHPKNTLQLHRPRE